MNKNRKILRNIWQKLTKNKDQLISLRCPLTMPDTPAYPIARRVSLQNAQPFEAAAVSFKLKNMGINHLNITDCKMQLSQKSRSYKNREYISLSFDKVSFTGVYDIDIKPDPLIDLDTAGNMQEFEKTVIPSKAGTDSSTSTALSPQDEAWLDQARDQRTKLNSTTNGQKLMGVYNQHNEVYNDVFQNSSAMRTTWKSGGVTKAMASDTSTALNSEDTVINDGSKTYKNTDTGEEVSYNSNAFKQQISLCFNTIFQDPSYNPFDAGSLPQGKYLDAAKATLSFAKVVQTTGNEKLKVKPMTQKSVYTNVDGFSGSMPTVSDKEVTDLMNQGQGTGGKSADGDIGWTVLDDKDRIFLQQLFEENLKERAEKNKITGSTLYTGQCHAQLDHIQASIYINEDQEITVDVCLPAFDLDINDKEWEGPVADITRNRLESTYFLRSLLKERLSNKIKEQLTVFFQHLKQKA